MPCLRAHLGPLVLLHRVHVQLAQAHVLRLVRLQAVAVRVGLEQALALLLQVVQELLACAVRWRSGRWCTRKLLLQPTTAPTQHHSCAPLCASFCARFTQSASFAEISTRRRQGARGCRSRRTGGDMPPATRALERDARPSGRTVQVLRAKRSLALRHQAVDVPRRVPVSGDGGRSSDGSSHSATGQQRSAAATGRSHNRVDR